MADTTKCIVKKKMANMFFDLQRKMMELERLEQRASAEDVDFMNISFLMNYIKSCQDGILSYLQRHYNWDKDEAMLKFYESKWYKNFGGDRGLKQLRSVHNKLRQWI